jgi:hypothetical protein
VHEQYVYQCFNWLWCYNMVVTHMERSTIHAMDHADKWCLPEPTYTKPRA